MDKKHARCGSIFVDGGVEVPKSAEIKLWNGRKCYLCGTYIENGVVFKKIKFLDDSSIVIIDKDGKIISVIT